MNTIYALTEPDTGEVRYIGVTKGPAKYRLRDHIRYAEKGGATYRCKWIRSLLRDGRIPKLLILEETTNRDREEHWIERYRSNGARLTNLTDGGDGSAGRRLSPEEIERRTKSRAGYTHSATTRQRISESNKGRIIKPESIEKMRASKTGKKLSEEKRVTHCKNGHSLTGDNLHIEVYGSRRCKTCRKAADERWQINNQERYLMLARLRQRRYQERKRNGRKNGSD